jgi:hypothetical protein
LPMCWSIMKWITSPAVISRLPVVKQHPEKRYEALLMEGGRIGEKS